MKWKEGRIINRLALPITRACNRKCLECPAREREGIYGKGPRHPHVSVGELKWVGKTLGPIGTIEMTGGEPSIHPDFVEISENIHEWFECNDIMLLTNGYIFEDTDKLPLLLNYDRIYVTHYTPVFAERYGGATNTEAHSNIRDYLKGRPKPSFWSQRMDKHDEFVESVPGATRCKQGYDRNDMVSYHRGQIYGCCVAWQLDYPGRGIVLTEDWRNHLNEIELPCDKCFLGVAE